LCLISCLEEPGPRGPLIHAPAEVCAECQTIAVHYYTVLVLISSAIFTLVAVMRFPGTSVRNACRSIADIRSYRSSRMVLAGLGAEETEL
jgi:hypothetical protein